MHDDRDASRTDASTAADDHTRSSTGQAPAGCRQIAYSVQSCRRVAFTRVAEIWKVNKDDLAGATQTWDAYLLGHDQYGTWLYTPAGTPIRNEQGQHVGTLQAQAQLYPSTKPWIASWFQDGSFVAAATTVAEVESCSIRFTDLGMQHRASGAVDPGQDETQEYDRALATGCVPSGPDAAIRADFTDLKQQIGERVEPFGEVGPKWFERIKRNEIHFVAYNPDWPAKFVAARDEIAPHLPNGSRVEHFGSTSVPGLSAKDCIDLAVVVPRPEQVQEVIPAMERLGYEARPLAFKDPGHIFFRRLTDGRRSHHLHLYRDGHPNLIGVLAFRDLLRSDPGARDRYQAVKQSLAEANPFDLTGYSDGKDGVVKELLQQALAKKAAADEAKSSRD